MLSRELEQATGSVGNADASFFAEWVDGGGGGGGGGGDDCGDGNGEGGGGEGDSGESSRASIGLIFVLDVTLLDGGVVCSRTKSSADSRAIQTAQHTSAKMLHRGSVSRCLGLATRGLASIPPWHRARQERVVLVLFFEKRLCVSNKFSHFRQKNHLRSSAEWLFGSRLYYPLVATNVSPRSPTAHSEAAWMWDVRGLCSFHSRGMRTP